MLGRLQTDRDKARVLDGLEGARRHAARRFDRARDRSPAVGARQARVPAAQRAREGADAVRNALDAVVPSRTTRTRRDQEALDGLQVPKVPKVPRVPKAHRARRHAAPQAP